ncbi:hypothetical protein COCCADRAFT_113187 [Bipolaris zeicola 26-R-13]|uniref:DDE-1 domain-containing protein n=1 Tax=Cochliobolus carbonum (strain 26-R-13) TaxID=930089 RepID=W6XMY6_COCC2|nr:uncharacterized protein COCCADRAFT_113187 [Bipolaris zeicola 26-R-13]EUC26858.1 hypothetical protein COCCADRAFT_113187 [Bipolaris zeicola 26-R-13]
MCRLPSHTSHKLQPCDVRVFGPLKTAYRDEVERLCRGGLEAVSKEHFNSIYKSTRETAMTRRNITAAWAASGLFPFNLESPSKDAKAAPRDSYSRRACSSIRLTRSSSTYNPYNASNDRECTGCGQCMQQFTRCNTPPKWAPTKKRSF